MKQIFADISRFNNINDYLPILNGCINADLLIMFMLFHGILFKSNYLKKWYTTFTLSACLADILILVIGIILARLVYHFFFSGFSIWNFTGLAVSIQIIHDLLFYYLFSITPIGYSFILDFFKKYAQEVSYRAILGDSFMMIAACLLSSYFAGLNTNMNIISLIVSLYFIPYILYMEK